MIHKAFDVELAFIVCNLAIVVSACLHPPIPAKPATAAPRVDAKSLIVNVADAIRITNCADLTPRTKADRRQSPVEYTKTPGPYRAGGK